MIRVLICIFCFAISACGVKGDPRPPDEPATLGRGQHNYKKATKGIVLPEIPPAVYKDEDQDEEQEEDSE